MANGKDNVVGGAIWMVVISVLLFWLPVIGPLLAGLVGGKKAGGVGNGILAALLPGVILAVVLLLASTLMTGLPVVGALMAATGFLFYVLNIGMLLLGAIVGGLLA
ncbi:hypothetical protein dsat_1833 [Alkalidesulfovibrio alkalitolerans DSM 16529]|jgi:hypothetical protein|uniref:Uncharacterized protein n=1 Tax=Alkalidesulfovibrio alkalitolerans DSM 16529 TaxID=1121439 RepID=S7UP14_9BACT|nr:hypothetical protein [Alkalidesulfovibrio alkalitolerans]EPR35729.1 hypothetical protein dsat_1833 [Alkalidesulfovibrio alkalitolerans DSM 16529]